MSFLHPKAIAVIGASAQPGKVGHDILHNLLSQGFAGEIYPVNPKGGEILGKTAYTSVAEIPGQVDLAIIVTPAPTVVDLIAECGKKGIPSAIIISAGFKEAGTDEGKAREEELKRVAKDSNVQIIGPNCLGILRPSLGMNASFAKELPPKGGIGLISQSGAFAVALLDASPELHLGYSAVFSIGNKAMLDECDILTMLSKDPETKVIGLYLENFTDGERFQEIASAIAKRIPIVLIKAGTSSYGKKAAASHTGSLAGSDSAVTALCAQVGIHRAASLEEFTDLLRVLSTQPPLPSSRVVIITNAGGPGILAADSAEREGLVLPSLSPHTETSLRSALPPTASTANPIDVIGDAGLDRYSAAFKACREDPNIDGIAVLLTPQVMTPASEIAKAIVDAKRTSRLLPVVASFMGGQGVADAIEILSQGGIPVFPTPERAMHALAALRPPKAQALPTAPASPSRQREALSLVSGQKGLLSEEQSKELLALYDLPLPQQTIARSAEEARRLAQAIGLPVVAKVSSPDILHKTDVGGIRVGLKTPEEVEHAYRQIEENVSEKAPDARIRGVLIQQYLPAGHEFIVGAVRDPSFGPLVMVGLGGIYTELFRDTAFRLAPINEEDAYAMLRELKSWPLLLGMRGKGQSDIPALARTLVQISWLVHECSAIQELDLNPVLVHEKDISIADVKVVVGA